MLILDSISKSYQKNGDLITALAPHSLTVRSGEFLAVQGPSGSGKTTLLLVAGGLLHPDSGTVKIDENNIYALNNKARTHYRGQHIGFIFQQYHLIPFLTVEENIVSPELALKTQNSQIRCNELIERFGLEHRRIHYPSELSAGEKQRTALARAVLHQPKLLLADEITGNLDRANAEIVIDYLKDFSSNGGAVLLVTHDNQAAAQADKIEYLAH
jgi:putative ABC transport system ATP-binding protein